MSGVVAEGVYVRQFHQMVLEEMHRAEKRYEVGRLFGKQEAKKRQLISILNKLTPQNFENLFEQLLVINTTDVVTLTGFVSQIVWRVTKEPLYYQMYAKFCCLMNKSIIVKRLVLDECQNLSERSFGDVVEGMSKLSEEDRGWKSQTHAFSSLGNYSKWKCGLMALEERVLCGLPTDRITCLHPVANHGFDFVVDFINVNFKA
ncbi:hypothetical protein J5N97_003790 [Dioscorea zingiberensis]|uniref:MIF4G domain-containing protein n=1 Tax=Dioscorea zingiberensis TaxID=325984 RepID=A0A9D5D6G9_9LILI|nr:hypothetical protein J5N97_003790 [Dioscorea zingiberensis]